MFRPLPKALIHFTLSLALFTFGLGLSQAFADDSKRLLKLLPEVHTTQDFIEILKLADSVPESLYASQLDTPLKKQLISIADKFTKKRSDEEALITWILSTKKRSPLADFAFLKSFPLSRSGLQRPSALYALKLGALEELRVRESSVRDSWRIQNGAKRLPMKTFGKDLGDALEFVDFFDFVNAVTHENPAPWALYDEYGKASLLTRWRDARNKLSEIRTTKNPDTLESLKKLHATVSGSPDGIRATPILAGGDVYVQDRGYYPVSAAEKAVLEKNPYLTVEVITNPYSGVRADFLARHEYPSVRHFRKWEDRLPKDLFAELVAAEKLGILMDFRNAETQRLTRRLLEGLIQELATRALENGYHAATLYQDLMSIHPFSDYNGRTLRLFYQLDRDPLFLVDWNDDLFLDHKSFLVEAEKGIWRRNDILKSFSEAELQNPDFPKYFDAPEIFRVISNVNQPDLKKFEGKKSKFREVIQSERFQAWIRQKRFFEAKEEMRYFCIQLFKTL